MTQNGKPEIQFVINRSTAQAIVDYLQTKPYSEVAALIAACAQLESIEKAGYVKAEPKTVEKLPTPLLEVEDTYEGTVAK